MTVGGDLCYNNPSDTSDLFQVTKADRGEYLQIENVTAGGNHVS